MQDPINEQTPLLSPSVAELSLADPVPSLSTFPSSLIGKRILLCTESFGPVNGVSRTTLMLVNHLRAHGAHVAVVAPHTSETSFLPTASPAHDVKANPELRISGYPLPFNPELSIVYPVRISTLVSRAWGEDAAPDLIYLASPASLGFQVMLQVRQQPAGKQIPVMCNFQTDLSGYCHILFPWPLSRIAVFAFDSVQSYLFRHPSVKTVFYPSLFVRRYLEKQHVPAEKMDVIRRGVRTDIFNPSHRSETLRARLAPNGEIILVCISRLAGEKGYDFLASVATELDKRGLAFTLYIVGGNVNPEVEAEIHGLFANLTAMGRVVFAGLHRGEELSRDYASADIFLHCSITETFGLVVLEAMASGLPVIARDEGGPSDIITHGTDGYLVPPNDLSLFVSKVELLSKDGKLREEMSHAALKTAAGATWESINNKVAWRMSSVIAERESHMVGLVGGNWRESLRLGWGISGVTARVKVAGCLIVILVFWLMTGVYLVFTEVGLAMKAVKGRWMKKTGAKTAEAEAV